MKTIEHLLIELAQRDIVLYAEDDRLKVNAPKGALTSELAAQIKARKQEITRFLARMKHKEQPIPRVARDRDLPLSFAQQRLWFLDQLERGGATYNVPLVNHLSGDINVDALKAALRAIVARHEVLRTSFRLDDAGPVQVIHEDFELPITVTDLQSQFDENDAFNDLAETHAGLIHLKSLIRERAGQPFDLETGHMWRVNLYLLSRRDLVLMLNMHHIVADGWSVDVIMTELTILYRAFADGQPSPLPPLPIQYADFSVWQRNWLEGERMQQQQEYWLRQLADLPSLLELPTDYPRPAVQSFEGAWQLITIPQALIARLEAFDQREGSTMFMTLMAVFNLLLARLTGQDDIAVGSPIANRERIELEGLIGYFANTFVLRTRIPRHAGFREMLAQVCEHTREAYDHQDLPFEHLVDLLASERSLSFSPLFQAMFTLRESSHTAKHDTGWRVTPIHPGATTSKFDLTLNLNLSERGVNGFLEYSTALFRPETIRRWFRYYLTLLEAVLTEPDREIGGLALLDERERKQILEDWNRTKRDNADAVCIHEHFEDQVAKTPERIAVTFDAMTPAGRAASLSFDALNRRANRLAHELRARGVGPDQRVGLCLDRSLEMVVGMLAILKAGGAYVPLDPAYPAERLAYMLADAKIQLMLTTPDMARRFPDSVTALFMTDQLARDRPDANVRSSVTPANLLYVIYTSGSTGRPKGIALSHEALVNLILWHLDDLPEPGGVLQFASMSFDASFHEIFAAWNAGDPLLLVPEELRYDFARLPRLLEAHQVRKVILPVVVLQQWAELFADDASPLRGLRDVITTGEQLQVTRPIIQLFAKLARARLHNHYGPAETHVVTAYRFEREPSDWVYHAPIGRPIANTQIYILDPYLQPTPEGVKGHLYIGGANLARGYLARPAMTAEKFIANPFGQPGERLYKTGDLARYLADGIIEFLGRADHMIKLRGFRVEPAEVEAVLTSDPRIKRAIVLAHGQAAQSKRLVAYVAPEGDFPDAVDALRGLVARQLPEYMAPSAYVILDELPLSPTGKVDREALPDPDFAAMSDESIVAPRNEVETELLAIWAQILELDPEKIGVHHNFFTLGGHSLSATRVISRVRKDFRLDIPLRNLFVTPTIAGLAEEIQNQRWLRESARPDDGEADFFEEAL